ncbi:MAG TPA: carboxypeptidase-like regulatory domain-containing protein, partial [Acidobacteriaceae bacterium]|nr:carboxypeptidase-like regulatory domain-containing protein [Acidobacteriaceae bacterium]
MLYRRGSCRRLLIIFLGIFVFTALPILAQSLGAAGSVSGTVTDPTGAAVPGATVAIHNFVSGYVETTTTDVQGFFEFSNLPLSHYHINVSQTGFTTLSFDADVNSPLPIVHNATLSLAGANTTVEVNGDSNDLV